ncbi:MAG: endonuclease/exonuclease/phosphatase family protein, partial [Xanthomonadales bacterium]|nr:endonuclease/exonuclease/phosphatase family protein [Xanthomonadales bacterium]
RQGEIIDELSGGEHAPARQIAAIIQRVRPDVILLNEFDYAGAPALDLFAEQYLAVGQHGESPIAYPYRFVAPVNTGVSAGVDLNGDGEVSVPEDAHGFGLYPGQFGMALLSRLPLEEGIRTFREFRWADMPDPWWPVDPGSGELLYSAEAREALRLSSKSHWDIPVRMPDGRTVHILASHPTPPVFDGPEDRNGRRNHDEIRFWRDYLSGADYMYDDAGVSGGLEPAAAFLIVGDMNADPNDGDSTGNPMAELLAHPRVNGDLAPASEGAALAGTTLGGVNRNHRGDHATDTARFNPEGAGNLRADYVQPSRNLSILDCGVFWPLPGEPEAEWIEASDHRLVWVDVALEAEAND